MLKKGDQAPGFELADDSGLTTTLSGLLEDGPIILYFYPKDFTSVCTRQACMAVSYTHLTLPTKRIV